MSRCVLKNKSQSQTLVVGLDPVFSSWFGQVFDDEDEIVAEEGGTKPVRWRVRPPSFVNLSVIPKLAEGHLVSDLIMINASLDIVLGEIDR